MSLPRERRRTRTVTAGLSVISFVLGTAVQVPLSFVSKDWFLDHLVAIGIAFGGVAVIGAVLLAVRQRQRPEGEDGRRAADRQNLAKGLYARVVALSSREEWSDERFTDLEAEVEVEGPDRPRRWRRRQDQRSMVRIPSLAAALMTRDDPLVLVEGEPGSGKSVALRHIALELADEARRSATGDRVLPLYVNLKEFRLGEGATVDATAVRDFVVTQVGSGNWSLERHLEAEFDNGLRDGTWTFLFDSFDEIPAILSSTEDDDIVEQYSQAIADFATTMNACRTIVASRGFKGPSRRRWTQMRIQRLTAAQRRTLVERLNLSPPAEARLLNSLTDPSSGVHELSENPLFLALLGQLVSASGEVPATRHATLERFVDERLNTDTHRLAAGYGLTPAELRRFAERVAFTMSATAGLGLSPSTARLREALLALDLLDVPDLDTALDALAYLRLARRDGDAGDSLFTFSHRRFQEYFTTCHLLHAPDLVAPETLLTDWQWRETAVTIFQTQTPGGHGPLLDAARSLLTRMVAAAERDWSGPGHPPVGDGVAAGSTLFTGRTFPWPPGSRHLLALLGDGFAAGADQLPDDVRELAARLLRPAFFEGSRNDARWACEVSHVGPASLAHDIVKEALGSKSPWLREAGFAQAGRLRELTADVEDRIAGALRRLNAGGRLHRDAETVRAQLNRLPAPGPLLADMRLLLAAPWLDGLLWALIATLSVVVTDAGPVAAATTAILALACGPAALLALRDSLRFDAFTRAHSVLRPVHALADLTIGAGQSELVAPLSGMFRVLFTAGLVLIAVPSAIDGGTGAAGPVAVVALAGYAVIWGPSVILPAFAVGPRPESPLAVACYPFTSLRRLAARAARTGNLARRVLVGAWHTFQVVVVTTFTVGPVFGGLLWVLFTYTPPLVVFVVFLVLFVVVLPIAVVTSVVQGVREGRRLQRFTSRPVAEWTDASVLEAVGSLRSASSLAGFLQSLQRHDLAGFPAVGALRFLAGHRGVLAPVSTIVPKGTPAFQGVAITVRHLWRHRGRIRREDRRREPPADWAALGYDWTQEQKAALSTWLANTRRETLMAWADEDVQDELGRLSAMLRDKVSAS